jgi:hypothetical protein
LAPALGELPKRRSITGGKLRVREYLFTQPAPEI